MTSDPHLFRAGYVIWATIKISQRNFDFLMDSADLLIVADRTLPDAKYIFFYPLTPHTSLV